MKYFRHSATLLAAGLSLCLAGAALGAENAAEDPGLLPLDDLRTFTKVYDHIRQGYVKDISDRELLEYAIKGMLAELDPHSAYLDANSFDDLQTNTTGEFGGLGIEVGMEDGFVKVISPMDDTPASKAGIESGDLIIKLGEKSVKGMTLTEAVKAMRGPKGSKIDVTLMREGEDKPREITLVRDAIKVQSVRARRLGDDYGYVRIAQFQIGTGKDMIDAINKLQKERPLQGIVLDLRNNPGGVLQASVEVVDAFVEQGLIVYTEGRIENADNSYSATRGDITNGLPIVVLINDGSASASEIVAGALQDHKRAIILGTESFGKGSVQTVIPISEERAIKLTTALYFTPSGRSIQAQGIAPDIHVERAKLTAIRPRSQFTEADLSGHLNNGNGGEESRAKQRATAQKEHREMLEKDNQLFEALNLLKGYKLFGRPTSTAGTKEEPTVISANGHASDTP
ncbi:S41 family peptidase [Simiduia aestuariiviva]|uniref:Carboxyl-terminal processing protease n=1 Tax=Simiduia aestuariiviva TaxID=1510459 RepID=A0A839UN13_9GAMM|nr:S41 family peptidase [Simiduia aestuariiviva]MBB3167136.1 carboxyl-terminal processing protease [Simiduia aestuariiviva]